MPTKTPLSTPLRAWQCPRCTHRTFTSSIRQLALGPEHPNYISIREPPQSGKPRPKLIKGRLPVPRDIFRRKDLASDKGTESWLARVAPEPTKEAYFTPTPGSREEWKTSLSAMRRQNLREGISSIRARKTRIESQLAEKQARHRLEREEILYKPERDDEVFTTPSHGLDVEKLLKGGKLDDPTAQARLEEKKANIERHVAMKKEERLAHVDTLFHHAKEYIVTQEQLDKVIDDTFGLDDVDVGFGTMGVAMEESADQQSVWKKGRPQNIGFMLQRSTFRPQSMPSSSAYGGDSLGEISKRRMRRIAEVLTGGKIDDRDDDVTVNKGW